MKPLFVALLLLFARLAAAATVDLDWKDTARDRPVPVRIYLPENHKPMPVVIFSHGLGGSRYGYAYLGRFWAGRGYVAVHVQHAGSDNTIARDGGLKAVTNLLSALSAFELDHRVADVKFTLDQLTRLNADPGSPLHGRLDLEKIAIAGHSFGAYTAQALVGEQFGLKLADGWADPRIRCAIVMSPSPPQDRVKTQAAFEKITLPVLFMSGTRDDSPIGDIKAADRRLPFDGSSPGDKYLITFDAADHFVFAGVRRQRAAPQEADRTDHPLIQKATTAFLDAYLKGDPAGKKYLQDRFAGDAGKAAKVEQK